ncbi:MAG: host attachment protein [Rhodobacteraceae bacterium]|nr:host attachment protein [Paracoccaceae bacterium]
MSPRSKHRQTKTARAAEIVEGRKSKDHDFPVTWLLVADGAQAQIYKVEPITFRLVPLPNGRFKQSGKHKGTKAGAGRSFNSANAARHAMEPHTDPHQGAEDRFLHDVAKALNEMARGKAVEDIMIAAPPKAMAVLRKVMNKAVQKKIAYEVTREWTKVPPPDMTRRLIRALV